MSLCIETFKTGNVDWSRKKEPIFLGPFFTRRLLRVLKYVFLYKEALDLEEFSHIILRLERFIANPKRKLVKLSPLEHRAVFQWLWYFWQTSYLWGEADLRLFDIFKEKYNTVEFFADIFQDYLPVPQQSVNSIRHHLFYILPYLRTKLNGTCYWNRFEILYAKKCAVCKKNWNSQNFSNPQRRFKKNHCYYIHQSTQLLNFSEKGDNVDTYYGAFILDDNYYRKNLQNHKIRRLFTNIYGKIFALIARRIQKYFAFLKILQINRIINRRRKNSCDQ